MHSTTERRYKILLILCERRKELIDNLAFELAVSRNTIKRDIEALSVSFPLYTTKGTGGGVHMMEGFRLGMKYLTDKQCALLERLLETLEGADKEVLYSIIKTFRKPASHK
ncbi:MAG: HTH domain-containing protein [Clostridiales bacterium]|nr:HTH domain-containing protein [Clostridiales bacterium]